MKTKPIFLIIAFILISITGANAQKLPNIQMVGVRAPVNAKADGKAPEWNNQFQAHNASADVLYTIANDDKNLYLVVQAKDVNVINTIVGYGFEFDIQKSGKKNDKDKISIAYPAVAKKGAPIQFGGKTGLLSDTSAGAANTVMANNNKVLGQKLKFIIVTGVKGLDTLSVYNEDGIKAAGQFDSKMVYTLEISLALRYIGLPVDGVSKFAYHIIINGYSGDLTTGKVTMMMNDGSSKQVDGNTPEIQEAMMHLNMRMAQRNPHTDFWGEYALVNK